MKKGILLIFLVSLAALIVLFLGFFRKEKNLVSPLGNIPKEKPLEKYTFENLKKTNFEGSEITIGKLLKDGDGFSSYVFYFKVKDEKSPPSARFAARRARQVSGLINLPKKEGTYPVVVMFRGFVDKKIYTIGEGTRHSGEVFAQNGFITLASDFLGYGESDNPSNNSIEERFQTYTTALTLLSSIKSLNSALSKIADIKIQADVDKIGIWGHSNGGHIALSVLEISGKNYPTVLWAPVSKPFPYSILYFTDEFDDHGKALRRAVADFEKDYDIEKYSPTNYLSRINAPIQLHQGESDESVPLRWSDQLYQEIKKLNKNITYFTYSGENHNFNNGRWPLAIQRSISFYTTEFQKIKNP